MYELMVNRSTHLASCAQVNGSGRWRPVQLPLEEMVTRLQSGALPRPAGCCLSVDPQFVIADSPGGSDVAAARMQKAVAAGRRDGVLRDGFEVLERALRQQVLSLVAPTTLEMFLAEVRSQVGSRSVSLPSAARRLLEAARAEVGADGTRVADWGAALAAVPEEVWVAAVAEMAPPDRPVCVVPSEELASLSLREVCVRENWADVQVVVGDAVALVEEVASSVWLSEVPVVLPVSLYDETAQQVAAGTMAVSGRLYPLVVAAAECVARSVQWVAVMVPAVIADLIRFEEWERRARSDQSLSHGSLRFGRPVGLTHAFVLPVMPVEQVSAVVSLAEDQDVRTAHGWEQLALTVSAIFGSSAS
jgi:hypothetical protein